MLRGCLLAGIAVGGIGAAGTAIVFHEQAEFYVCDPRTFTLCRHLEFIGFDFGSGRNAALILGSIAGFIAFVLCLMVVLHSDSQRQRTQ